MWNCDQTTRIISDQVIHRGLGMSGPLLAAIVKLAASRQCFSADLHKHGQKYSP